MTPSDSPGRNYGLCANSAQLSFTETELYRYEISIGCNAKFWHFATFEWLLWQQGLLGGKFK